MQKLLLIAIAGAAGSLSRYALAGAVQRVAGSGFPWGTAVVNVLGCLVAGLVWQLFEGRVNVSPETRIIVFVGFLGAFTTFSSLMLETSHLSRDSEWMLAAGNVLLHNGLGFASVLAGIAIGRWIG
ncbi:MAG: putative fluoride ion transporter CrcB [Candidatus Hydrogenedentota bacterium]